MSAEKSLRRRSAKAGVLGALSLLAVAATVAPASAQFFGGMWGGVPFADVPLPPRAIARILHDQGFRLTTYPARRGNRIVALGTDGRGQMHRFVMDAYDGDILRAVPVGPRTSNGREAYAYGAPGAYEETRPLPKPKQKPRSAARTPAPLPQAAPASPAPPPSQSAQPPAPVVPAAPPPPVEAAKPPATPPVAATPPVTPATPPVAAAPPPPSVAAVPPADAPPVRPQRPAVDAQPRDVGPKIVPVKPNEARAPDSWDTEAEPAKPADTAPNLPVERYKE